MVTLGRVLRVDSAANSTQGEAIHAAQILEHHTAQIKPARHLWTDEIADT